MTKTLYTFTACHQLLNLPNQGQGMTLALGDARAAFPRRIIQTTPRPGDHTVAPVMACSAKHARARR